MNKFVNSIMNLTKHKVIMFFYKKNNWNGLGKKKEINTVYKEKH